ncbi:hypothetical protein E4O86_02360 [Rhizobiales bacterium L72]|uniref:Tc1-like transposase DDE domain-containing protein n=1 Tax=Propylenella binzhouense TaxID=2555902 RepID=A0A964WS39_9HYPH|nr:hypothetical protein [Propylenella binzhouense]
MFIDETWAKTDMARTHGRGRRVERLLAGMPHGHWKKTTCVGALTLRGMMRPSSSAGRATAAPSRPRSERCPSPGCAPATWSSWTSSPATRGRGRALNKAAGASLLFLPPYSPGFNPIENAFAKLNSLLRRAAERPVEARWASIGPIADAFSPAGCASSFSACG